MGKIRKRVSIYDPFREKIEAWCEAGVPVREMANELGAGYTIQGIYAYIISREIRKKRDVYEARNHCDKCNFCHKYINTNNTEGRICTKSWKTIQPGVVYSPRWCEKGKEYEKSIGRTKSSGDAERNATTARGT